MARRDWTKTRRNRYAKESSSPHLGYKIDAAAVVAAAGFGDAEVVRRFGSSKLEWGPSPSCLLHPRPL